MASDGVSLLNKTPLSSNCSGTPEILIGTQPPGLKRINFERCLDGQIDQNVETFNSPTDMSAKQKIEHYRKLPSRTDGSDNMESLFEQGYDSDGERAPYLNYRDMDLEDLEKSCDVRVGEEPPATGEDINNSPTPESSEDPENEFVLIEESKLKKLKMMTFGQSSKT